jgi:hypothetical protein
LPPCGKSKRELSCAARGLNCAKTELFNDQKFNQNHLRSFGYGLPRNPRIFTWKRAC